MFDRKEVKENRIYKGDPLKEGSPAKTELLDKFNKVKEIEKIEEFETTQKCDLREISENNLCLKKEAILLSGPLLLKD